jgi:hypothetical protein
VGRRLVDHDVLLDALELAELRLDRDPARPRGLAASTTSFVIARFSSKGLEEASIMTEVQPASMLRLQLSTSLQWSRWRATGTGDDAASSFIQARIASWPQNFTVLTEVCTMTGEESSSAARTTALAER